jgi:hypothetical protein
MAKIKVLFMKDMIQKLSKDEISFSRLCELINEEASRKEEPIPIAYEFHNNLTGHCYVDYIGRAGMTEQNGYIKTPLYYKKSNSSSYPLKFRG